MGIFSKVAALVTPSSPPPEIRDARAKVTATASAMQSASEMHATSEKELADRNGDVATARKVSEEMQAAYLADPSDATGAKVHAARGALDLAVLRVRPVKTRHDAASATLETVKRTHDEAKAELDRVTRLADLRHRSAPETLHEAVRGPWSDVQKAVDLIVAASAAIETARTDSHEASDELRSIGEIGGEIGGVRLDEAHAAMPLLEDLVARGTTGVLGPHALDGHIRHALALPMSTAMVLIVRSLVEWRAKPPSPMAAERAREDLEMRRTSRTTHEAMALRSRLDKENSKANFAKNRPPGEFRRDDEFSPYRFYPATEETKT